ncbi:tetratricopeptide repeat protein [Acanthopleuribacter pedis]|uniref:Tetratricopeptide repeat protein n=1 Tax=Acanthopleuribacter pedis TaxID=442870 RepID=A0A8J7U2E7_9BACT|nr:hypothetical protein [Acanthopleuribacter pedis]MBO1317624.1 hypothetical protein [Acanthopleuribacter pedis]
MGETNAVTPRKAAMEAKRLAQQGEQMRLAGDPSGAVALFSRALEWAPRFAWALAHRGAAHRQRGKEHYRAALADFEQALVHDPDYVWAIAFRARMYELFRDYQRALVDFDRAIAMDDTIIGFWRSERALLLCFNRRYQEARVMCDEALRCQKNDHFATYVRAVIAACFDGGRDAALWRQRAEKLLQPLALEPGPEQGIALYRLAGLTALYGAGDQAKALLRRALPLEKEAVEFARHDPAWYGFYDDQEFQLLVTDRFGDLTVG